uniref:Saxitoxin and tetrodotoxin-binding protein 1-like n=1 Tax=Kryptolebias marmoratus TaxID=37003 RepID=A0A3Q3BSA5_KRYMA
MSFLKGTILLLLLVVIGTNAAPGPAAEECANVTKRLPTKDLHEIFGDWVLVWSVSNHDLGHGLLENLLSSHVEFKLDNDNKTIDYIERNQFVDNGNLAHCTTYYTKMTMPSDDAEHHTINLIPSVSQIIKTVYTEIGDVDFYQTCDDCLLMDYKTSTHQFLLFYRREGSHQDVEQHKTHHADHLKVAECLGFPQSQPFIYNGKAEICKKKIKRESQMR